MRRRRRRRERDSAPPEPPAAPGPEVDGGGDGDGPTFEDGLEALGFRVQGSSRRGGRQWALAFNRYLTFVVHDYGDAVVLSWSYALGEFLDSRGWRVGVTDTSTVELYPTGDVRLPVDAEAVGGEITRVLASLRLDLGDPSL